MVTETDVKNVEHEMTIIKKKRSTTNLRMWKIIMEITTNDIIQRNNEDNLFLSLLHIFRTISIFKYYFTNH